jgi:heme/copper-type cytochrome/quinol oxidase subunit 2
MNGPAGNWRSAFSSAAMTLFGVAIALYVAVLITLGVLAALAYAVWFFHRRRSGW